MAGLWFEEFKDGMAEGSRSSSTNADDEGRGSASS